MDVTTKVADGPLAVSVIPGKRPWAVIDFDGNPGGSYMNLDSAADCDRLIIAATTAKRMLELAAAGTPHAYEGGAGKDGGNCARCGQFEREGVHAAAVLDASIASGQPVIVEDDSPFADRHHDPDVAWAAGDDTAVPFEARISNRLGGDTEPPVHSGEGITGLHWDHLGSWGDAS